MKLICVNVGLTRKVIWKGKPVRTGIFKEPVNAKVMVRKLNLDGDQQADLTLHGGIDILGADPPFGCEIDQPE